MAKYDFVFQRVPSFLGVDFIRNKEMIAGYDAVVLGFPWEGSVNLG